MRIIFLWNEKQKIVKKHLQNIPRLCGMLTWMLNGNPQLHEHIRSNSDIKITFAAWTTNILNILIKKKKDNKGATNTSSSPPPPSLIHLQFIPQRSSPSGLLWFRLPPSAFFSHPLSSLFFHPLGPLHFLHPYLSKHAIRRSPWWFLYLPSFSQASSSPLHGYHCSPSLLVFLYLCSSASPLGSRIVSSLSDLQSLPD